MAEVDLTYVVRAQDRTRAVFQQVTQSVQRMNATVGEAGRTSQRSFAGMAASATMASRSVQLLHTSSRSLSLSMRNLHAPLVGVVRGVGSLAQGAAHAAGAIASRLNQALQTMGRLLAGTALAATAAATAALVSFAKAGVSMNVTLDGARAALTRMTGSSQNAQRLLGGLRQEALASSLTFKEMLPIAQSLVGVLGAGGLGQVIPIMRAFGDTAAALQVPQAGLQNALLGFRQMLSKPLVQQEEVNQINESLPGANISGILTRAFGTSDTEVLQKAGVTGKQAGEAIIKGLQQAFGGSQAAAAGSIPMLFSAIQDGVNDLSASVSRGLTASLQRALAALNRFLSGMQQSKVGAAALGVVRQVLDGVGKGLEGLIQGVPRLLQAFVTMAQSPGLRAFGAVLVRIFADLKGSSTSTFEAITQAWQTLWQGAAGVLDFARRLFVSVLAGLGASVRGMGLDWAQVWARMAQWTKNAVKIIGGSIAGVVGVFEDLGKVQRDGQTGFQKLGESIKSWAIGTISAVASVGVAVLGLVGVYGALIGTIAALTRNATLGLEAGKALAISFGGAFAILAGAAALKKGVQGINFDKDSQAATGINVGQSYRTRRDQFTSAFEDAFQSSGQPAFPGMPAPRQQVGPGPDSPAAPQLRSQVRGVRQYRQPGIAGAGQMPRDPFAPITLPNGQVIPRWRAEQLGIGAQGPTTPPLPAPSLTESASAASASASPAADTPSGGISLPINIMQFDLTDPRFRARLHQLIDERLDYATRRAGLRGAF